MNYEEKKIMISLNNLCKKFGSINAVDHLNISIRQNEIFGLLGPNGAGKTTTINMICGLLPPTEGSIQFSSGSQIDKKSLIGYCPQENIFYPKLTCIEQLVFIGQMFGLSAKKVKHRALELLDLMGLKNKTKERAARLSGGMKRRLNICLALIHDPEILILDEPEAGLDPQSRVLVRDFIRDFSKDKTIILTTHNMDEADRMADRIAIIDYGKLLMLDTSQNLKRTIGEGDILELIFENGTIDQINEFSARIGTFCSFINKTNDFVIIKNNNITESLPFIKELAKSCGLIIAEIKIRENTLEDVFIHLTGRNIRI